jgi:hypothetical protein
LLGDVGTTRGAAYAHPNPQTQTPLNLRARMSIGGLAWRRIDRRTLVWASARARASERASERAWARESGCMRTLQTLTNADSSRTQNSLVSVDGHMRTPFCHFQRRWAQPRCDLDRVGTKVVQGWYKALQGWYKVVQRGTRAQRLSEPASGLMQTVQPSRANTTRMASFVPMA